MWRDQMRLYTRLLRAAPRARCWVGQTLREHRHARRPVSSFGFARLNAFFPAAFLDAAGVVVVDECPRMPLGAWGLPELEDASPRGVSGITFLDTFFVRDGCVGESLFFHELIHVAQWERLGFFRFALLYGLGLGAHGYLGTPLEETAYRLQREFDGGADPFDALARTQAEANALGARFRSSGPLPRAVWLAGALVPPPRR